MLAITLGKRSLFGHQWITRKEFAKELVMMIKGTYIEAEAFVKFVRHKLGGAHFDSRERRRWQQELIAMSRYWDNDSDFVNHHMREVLRAVCEGIAENRIEQHARQ